ncbi:MAG TPA: orotidine-5'-phosphate decarboxylase, partial [Acidimicrobiales bacterium]|nr:orotidine-5'-phosphate decarboxylase [Acidimicrobiales bacterium]
ERHGAAGLAALEGLLAEARQAGLLVIADAKRGDVESTSAAYADAWLGDGPLAADAVTATPYVGLGALSPMVDLARRHGRCVLVVVRTSNREGRAVQESVTALGVALEDALFAEIAEANRVSPGALGAVVGATLEPSRFDLAGLGGPVLAPGVGAQGATPGDVGRRFSGLAVGAVLPSASRSLLDLGPAEAALRAGAAELRDALARALA